MGKEKLLGESQIAKQRLNINHQTRKIRYFVCIKWKKLVKVTGFVVKVKSENGEKLRARDRLKCLIAKRRGEYCDSFDVHGAWMMELMCGQKTRIRS